MNHSADKADLSAAHKYLSGVYQEADAKTTILRDLRRISTALLIMNAMDREKTAKEIRVIANAMDPILTETGLELLDNLIGTP